MKRIFYIALMTFVLVGLFVWIRMLPPDSACPEVALSSENCAFIGHRITNSTGTELGTVRNVVVDIKDGRLVYAIVSFNDPAFYGKAAMTPLKDKIVPIPWRKLTFVPAQKTLLLKGDATMLANAPHLDNISQGIDRKLDAEIQQYWTKAEDGEVCYPCRQDRVWN